MIPSTTKKDSLLEERESIQDHLLAQLNEVQKEAVISKDGPLLIVAGAGSGKTRVITHRIAYLIKHYGIAPWNIASVTFTNKAAEEMKTRLSLLIGRASSSVFVRTFHSMGLYIVSRHTDELGISQGFSIVDQSGQKTILKKILSKENIPQDFLSPISASSQINHYRNLFLAPDDVRKDDDTYSLTIAGVYERYLHELRKNNSVDFGDLLYLAVKLLRENEDIRAYYQNLWKYFMIDEYQDTNHTQYLLGRLIASEHKNVMVVGDDDQSIYSWRGADIANILCFEKDYPEAKILHLEENYRSTPMILKAASSVIAKNEDRRSKTIFTQKNDPLPIFCNSYNSEENEAHGVVEAILSYQSKGIPLGKMAVFYRTNAQSRIFERVLREKALPYIIIGDIRFYERKEIKDLLAYLHLIVNPNDDISLERIINVPARGIGPKGISSLYSLTQQEHISLLETLPLASNIQGLRSAARMKQLYQNFYRWRDLYENQELPSLIAERVLEESGYLSALKNDSSYESEARVSNLYEFLASLRQYEQEYSQAIPSAYEEGRDPESFSYDSDDLSQEENHPNLAEYLQRISLHTDNQTVQESPEDQEKSQEELQEEKRNSCLNLMTLHSAKGLEFQCVFLCGLEEGYIPHFLSIEENNVEEERRLLYVGITRSLRYLHLNYAESRWIFGKPQPRIPSRFFSEMDPKVFGEARLPFYKSELEQDIVRREMNYG